MNKDAYMQVRQEREEAAEARVDWRRRQEVPSYIVDALEHWLYLTANDGDEHPNRERVHYWVHGDEAEPNKEDKVNDPIRQVNPANGESVELQPVYIVDGESDPNSPIIVKAEITVIVHDGGEDLSEYLGTLLSDACDGYNMTFVKDLDSVRKVLTEWNNNEDDDHQIDIDAILQGQESPRSDAP